jgi:hypothetical protein
MSKELRIQCMYLEDASIEQLEKQLAKRKQELSKGLHGKPKLLKKINWNELIKFMEAYHTQMIINYIDCVAMQLGVEDVAAKAFECAYGLNVSTWHHKMTLRYPGE